MIVISAIKKGNSIRTGIRHHNIFQQIKDDGLPIETLRNSIQGFLTDKGKFLNRKQAGKHAYKCGQIKTKIDCLISEDLW